MAKRKSTEELSNRIGGVTFSAVVIGTSAGGLAALGMLCRQIERNFPIPFVIVQHLPADSDDFLARNLAALCHLNVREACEKELLAPSTVYTAPANYHLLIESDFSFSLNVDPKVNYCRPSIDVLFESAASVFKNRLIGIILTGANNDGARGLKYIKAMGGRTIVQHPESAEVPAMPQAAINLDAADYIVPLPQIFPTIKLLTKGIK